MIKIQLIAFTIVVTVVVTVIVIVIVMVIVIFPPNQTISYLTSLTCLTPHIPRL
jgi:hypothetical protein